MTRHLYVLACGAGPASDVAELATLAMTDGWGVYVGATPAGWAFLDVGHLHALTGHVPRHDYSGRTSGWPPADGIVVAPATSSSINPARTVGSRSLRREAVAMDRSRIRSAVRPSANPAPRSAPILVPGDPQASLLFQKLGPDVPCGSLMPLGQSALSDDDLACISAWIGDMQ